MRTPVDVFEDFSGRRRGIVKALTTDVEKFYQACDPSKDNLTLFAFPDGSWAVDLPAEEVPPEVPEPALGINFARDHMSRKDWLCLVAMHSDAWLLSLAFFKGARFDMEQRQELFNMISRVPTCFDVVSGKSKVHQMQYQQQSTQPVSKTDQQQQQQLRQDALQQLLLASRAQQQQQQPQSQQHQGMSIKQEQQERLPQRKHARKRKKQQESESEEEPQPVEEEEEEEDDLESAEPCPMCNQVYSERDFWIACDTCDQWFCQRCSKMTQAKADAQKTWHCPPCLAKRGGKG